MRQAFIGAGLVLSLWCRSAAAQEAAPQAADVAPKMPPWDISATFGLHWVTSGYYFDGNGGRGEYSEPQPTWTVGIGRYFGRHLKADAAVTTTSMQTDYFAPPTSSIPPGGAGFYEVTSRPQNVSLAATWQLLENAFVHPYVSGGTDVLRLDEQRTLTVYDRGYRLSRTVADNPRIIRVRPFAAAGFKSYFNERVFMRSELHFGFSGNAPAVMLRVGAGVDF